MRLRLLLPLSLCLLPLLNGCANLGLAPAPTLDDKIVYAYGTVDAVLKAIPPSIRSGLLSSARANTVDSMALNVKALLDSARTAEAQNPPGAEQDLALALAALTAVQNYLSQNGVKL